MAKRRPLQVATTARLTAWCWQCLYLGVFFLLSWIIIPTSSEASTSHHVARIALISQDFDECWAIDVIESHASIPSPYQLANRTCHQLFDPSVAADDDDDDEEKEAREGRRVTTFPTCAWDVVLPAKTVHACTDALESYLIKMFNWANAAQHTHYVAIPVQVAQNDRLFLPHSPSTLSHDAQAFCEYHAIETEGVGGGCAESLIAAAEDIYDHRLSPLPIPGEGIVICPHRSRVAFVQDDDMAKEEEEDVSDARQTGDRRKRRIRRRSDVPLAAFYHVAALQHSNTRSKYERKKAFLAYG